MNKFMTAVFKIIVLTFSLFIAPHLYAMELPAATTSTTGKKMAGKKEEKKEAAKKDREGKTSTEREEKEQTQRVALVKQITTVIKQSNTIEFKRLFTPDILVTQDDIDGFLFLATLVGNHLIAEELLKNFADANAACNVTQRFLARKGCQPDCLRPFIFNQDGVTPLHISSFFGDVETTNVLLRYSASMFNKTKRGETPLHFAALELQTVVLQDCESAGFIRDYSRRQSKTECIRQLFAPIGSQPLCTSYANMQDKQGNIGLHLAVMSKNPSVRMIEELLEYSDEKIKNKSGVRPVDLVKTQKLRKLFPKTSCCCGVFTW